MTDMAELKRRKQPLNLAIVHADAEAFISNLMGLAGNHRLHYGAASRRSQSPFQRRDPKAVTAATAKKWGA